MMAMRSFFKPLVPICVPSHNCFSTSLAHRVYQVGQGDHGDVTEKDLNITEKEVVRFMTDCMVKVDTPKHFAERLALNLVAADVRGHFSHGLSRLAHYVSDVNAKTCDPKAKPEILKEGPSTAWVDGKNGLGVVTGEFSMNLAISKAKASGVGWVAAKGSNHFGICQWYSQMALEHNLIGASATNTSPFVAPTRGKTPIFGTNPISFAAPGLNGDSYILDMSTSSVAVGKIEIQMRRKEPLPTESWALGWDGKPTKDPTEAFQSATLLPLGGAEINSGYKGYGLGMLVELLCGLMSGSHYAHNVRKWTQHDVAADLGQAFIAVDPECFAPGMSERLQDLMNHLRSLSPVDASKPVLVPGDPERLAIEETKRKGAIRYTPDHILSYRQLAKDLGVLPMESASL